MTNIKWTRLRFGAALGAAFALLSACGVSQDVSTRRTEVALDQNGSTVATDPSAGSAIGVQTGACTSYDYFHSLLEPKLTASCGSCHGPSGVASHGFAVGAAGDDHADWELAKKLVSRSAAGQSLIVTKPTGQVTHGGGAIYAPTSADANLLVAWATEEQRCVSLAQGANSPASSASNSNEPYVPEGAQVAPDPLAANCPTYKSFASDVSPTLDTNCGSCHGPGGQANGFFPISPANATCSALAATWHEAERRINVNDVDASLLLRKGTGAIAHSGGEALSLDGPDYKAITNWIAKAKVCQDTGGGPTATINPCVVSAWHLLLGSQIAPIYDGNTVTIPAELRMSDGTSGSMAGAVWTSSDPGVATVDAHGKFTALKEGSTKISISVGGLTKDANFVVSAAPNLADMPISLQISPSVPNLKVGSTEAMLAQGVTAKGKVITVIGGSWTSSDPGIVTVSDGGVLTGVSIGNATISMSLNGLTASAPIIVVAPKLVSLTLSTTGISAHVGDKYQFVAMGTFEDHTTAAMAPGPLAWTSSLVSRASINSQGLASFLTQGAVTFSVASGAVKASASVMIEAAYYKKIAITPASLTLTTAQTAQLTAIGKMSDGSNTSTTSALTWASSDPSVATVSSGGLVTAVQPGFVLVTAIDGAIRSSVPVVAQNAGQCNTQSDFAANVQPIFDESCASCHTGNGVGANFFTMIGPDPDAAAIAQNFRNTTQRINVTNLESSVLLDKVAGRTPHGPNTQPLLPESSAGYVALHGWAQREVTCEMNTTKTNLARSSAEALQMRLLKLFPSGNTIPAHQGYYSDILQPPKFDIYASTGLMRTISSADRNTNPAAQIALRGAISQLCYAYSSTNTTMFAETGMLLPSETMPADPATKLAFLAARNVWIYPYSATSSEVVALTKAYNDGAGTRFTKSGASQLSADATGRLMLCVATLMAPQFWMGNPGDDDVVRRVAVEIGRMVPSMSDFADFRNAADKTAFMGTYTRNIQTSTSTRGGYLTAVHSWHKDWLGLRDFINGYPAPVGPSNGSNVDRPLVPPSAGGPAGLTPVQEMIIPTSKTGLTETAVEVGMLYSGLATRLSEACTPGKKQDFDPETTSIVWQHFNHFTHTWETIGSWVKTGSTWTMQNGQITLADNSKLTTNLTDIHAPIIDSNLKAHYTTGNLSETPVDHYVMGERRVRRFSPSGEQDGYSPMKLWYSGETVYSCNTVSRMAFTCSYRAPTAPAKGTWNAALNVPVLYLTAPVDSLVHPNVFENYRCGVPNYNMITQMGTPSYDESIAYPRGTPGNYNTLAYNMQGVSFGPPLADQNPDDFPTATSPSAEVRARGRLTRDVLSEPNRLLDHLLTTNGDYRELLTASYTFGGAELDLYYRQAAQWLVTYPDGYVAPSSESDAKSLRTISMSNVKTLPFSVLKTSWGCAAGMPCPMNTASASGWGPSNNDFRLAGGITPHLMSGILTQPAFLGPIATSGGKARSIAARVFSRLMCGLPSDFLSSLDGSGTTLSKSFMQTKETTTALHLDETKGCYTCHVLLDPVAAIFNRQFMSVGLGTQRSVVGEVQGVNALGTTLLGVIGGRTKANGAFLGQPVSGVSELAHTLSNSRQFARCAVQQAFGNVFGRHPAGADFVVIDRVTDVFTTSLNYDYNEMIEALVKTPEFMRGN